MNANDFYGCTPADPPKPVRITCHRCGDVFDSAHDAQWHSVWHQGQSESEEAAARAKVVLAAMEEERRRRRDEFAKAALTGLLANPVQLTNLTELGIATVARMHADMLIAELDKVKP